MKAVVWHGKEDVRVESVPDPRIEKPTDAVVRVTSTAVCGSDLHLYSKLGAVMKEGDVIGHEPMGIVEEVGAEVGNLRPGDRVVVPFNIACGTCFMCARGLQSQCETTQNRRFGKGASLFGYTHLYGGVSGGQAEYLRVPLAHYGPIKVPDGPPDNRFLLLSDVLPTAWQAVRYADVPEGGTVAVWGLGPIGQMAARVALRLGAGRVLGVDAVPERLAMAQRHGVETIDHESAGDVVTVVRELTDGRGADSVIDAVGLEADGSVFEAALQATRVQIDRFHALRRCHDAVRRGGTLSIVGVYAGYIQMFNIGDLFDRQITIRMGQANVRRWTDEILPQLLDGDSLGTDDLVTHELPLEEAPRAYELFQKKEDGCIKVVLRPDNRA
ncbi:MAG TPA: zinc-dependent alcohol dehydrogenase [Gaiellaceae bacterium]|nr:zinc-dependent alcohol dehydrogenase [Gaiellaceae bacterium]